MNAKEKAEEIAEIACFRDFCTCEINVVKLIELALTEARVEGMREAALHIECPACMNKGYGNYVNAHEAIGKIRQAADEIEKELG